MATQQAPDGGTGAATDSGAATPGTAVTTTRTDDDATGVSMTKAARDQLPEHVRLDMMRRRQVAETAKIIGGLSWGKAMQPDERAAVAYWAASNLIDIETEVDILGGKYYLNAKYFRNRLQPLIDAGRLTTFDVINVSPDERLDEIAAREPEDDDSPEVADEIRTEARWARAELRKRERWRIARSVPPEATVAFVCVLGLDTAPGVEFVGCKWYVPGAQVVFNRGKPNQFSKDKDAVGDSGFSVESVETRAIRRAAVNLVGKLPTTDPLRQAVDRAKEEGMTLSEILNAAKARELMEEAQRRRDRFHRGAVTAADPYETAHEALPASATPRALGAGPAEPVTLADARRELANAPGHGRHEAPTRVIAAEDAAPPVSAAARYAATIDPDPMGLDRTPAPDTSGGHTIAADFAPTED